MNQYRVVDMSNDKYIIKGISLGKNINSYFCMNKGNLVKEVIIIDNDVMSVMDGQVVFSIKNVSLEWIDRMIYSFCHLFMENKYDLKNMKIEVKIENQDLKNKIEEFLIKMGVYNRDVETKKEDNVSIEDNVLLNQKQEVLKTIELKKEDTVLENKSENEQKNNYVDMVSEFDVDMINDNDDYEDVSSNSGKIVLPMTLFVMSIFLFIASGVLFVMT